MVDRIGQQFGNYQLIRLLGRGGFAVVYLGQHVYLKTNAAIKLLPTFMRSEDIEDFLAEAQTLARLAHPHIVRILDFAVVEETPFLVMDYAPNGTLRESYPKGTRLPLETVISYANQVASALQYAHDQNLIHRDVKPENLLLGARNEVLLSDFGIAAVIRTTGSLSMQEIAGTVHYMAPEQLQGKLSRTCDQYALGIVVYEWLCGSRPFQGSRIEIMSQHLYTQPPPLHEKVPTIPWTVEQTVMRALAKDPQQRFSSVQDFAEALEQTARILESTFPVYQNNHPSPYPERDNVPRPPINQPKPTPFLGLPPEPVAEFDMKPVSNKKHSGGPSKGFTALLVSIILIVLSGSIATYFALQHSPDKHLSTPTVTNGVTYVPVTPPPAGTTMFGYNAQHIRFNPLESKLSPANVASLELDWSAGTGFRIAASPVVVNGIVYIGSEDGRLYAFDTLTHKLLWSSPPKGPIDSSPAVANGVVYVGNGDHQLYAFDTRNGTPYWPTPATTAGGITSSPVIVNGIIYVGSLDHHLYAFYASSGKPFWSAPSDTGDQIESSPAVANGVVYVGSNNGNLYAFDANSGARLWFASTGDFIYSSPAVVDGIVYVGSADHYMYAFSAAGCSQSPCPPLWRFATGDRIVSSPAIGKGVVYIGSEDKKLYALDAKSGQILWSSNPTDVGDIFFSSPFVANGVVYIGSYDKKLYAFNAAGCTTPASCSPLWSSPPAGDIIRSSPVVVDGVVYIASYDKMLYAFHLPGATP